MMGKQERNANHRHEYDIMMLVDRELSYLASEMDTRHTSLQVTYLSSSNSYRFWIGRRTCVLINGYTDAMNGGAIILDRSVIKYQI